MMKNNVKSVDFSIAINATSAFLTIVIMVLSYSITKGIGVGMISYTLMSAISFAIEFVIYAVKSKRSVGADKAIIPGENKESDKPKWNVSVVALIVTALFIVYFFVPTV